MCHPQVSLTSQCSWAEVKVRRTQSLEVHFLLLTLGVRFKADTWWGIRRGPWNSNLVGKDGDRLLRHILGDVQQAGTFWLKEDVEYPGPVGEGSGYGQGWGARGHRMPGLILVEELRLTTWL